MDRLQLSSDSVDTVLPKKRLRVEDSEDDTDLPAKKRQSLFNEQLKILQNDDSETLDKNDTNACNVKEEKTILYPEKEQNVQEIFLSDSNMGKKNKDKQDAKQENGNEILLNENNIVLNKNPGEINIKKEIVEKKDNPCEKSATSTSVVSTSENNQVGTEDNEVFKKEIDEKLIAKKEAGMKKQARNNQETKKCTVDTEVVDGLELYVECASDKEESSSDSEKEKDAKPRPKTVIVKAEPNESELDCSSEGVKSDSQRATDTLEIKLEKSRVKRRSSRTSFSKLKASDSEDSQNSNSDEDYSPRTKKKMKKSLTTKRLTNEHRLVESKRGRGKSTRYSPKKNADHNNDHISDEDTHATVTEKANETTKIKNEMEEELSERESLSKSSSDNDSEKEERSRKGRKRRRSNVKPQDKHIQKLKKYLSVAGVKIKSYDDFWADCKSNAAKIKRLKQLLEENGITGRPTLEKCKRVKKKNEKMKEVSELDTSNIISEGRITRARRNMENVKKTPPDTPPRHREARNTFKRIQTVVDIDSDSE
ncbi:cylicin-1 isoform X2 [Solenopsis invicta]|nr:cylicin-1 isoform X2 [Solenopsis invicta]